MNSLLILVCTILVTILTYYFICKLCVTQWSIKSFRYWGYICMLGGILFNYIHLFIPVSTHLYASTLIYLGMVLMFLRETFIIHKRYKKQRG